MDSSAVATPARGDKIRILECGTVRTLTDVDEEDDKIKAVLNYVDSKETPVKFKLSEKGEKWDVFVSPWESEDFEKARKTWEQIQGKVEDFGAGVRGAAEETIVVPGSDADHKVKVSRKGGVYSFACPDLFGGTLTSIDELIRVIDEIVAIAGSDEDGKGDKKGPKSGESDGDAAKLLETEKNEDAVIVLIRAGVDPGSGVSSRGNINKLMKSLYPNHSLSTVLAPSYAKNGELWKIEGERGKATFELINDGMTRADELMARPGIASAVETAKAALECEEEDEDVKPKIEVEPEGPGEYFVCNGTKIQDKADPKGHCLWKSSDNFSNCQAGKLAFPGDNAYKTLEEAMAVCKKESKGGVMFVPKRDAKRKSPEEGTLLERLRAESSETEAAAKLRQNEVNKLLNKSTTAASAPAVGTPEYLPFLNKAYQEALDAANAEVAKQHPPHANQAEIDRLISELEKEEALYSQFETVKGAIEARETISAEQPAEDFLASLKALNSAKEQASTLLSKIDGAKRSR